MYRSFYIGYQRKIKEQYKSVDLGIPTALNGKD